MSERETNDLILSNYQSIRSSLTAKTKYLEMVEDAVDTMASGYYNIFDPPVELSEKSRREKAAVAQKIEIEGRADIYYSPCYVSMMIRAIDEQIKLQGSNSSLKASKEILSIRLEELKGTIESKYDCRHYPLRDLIRMNLGAVLYSADYASKRNAQFQMWH